MTEAFSRRDLVKLTKGLGQFPDIATENIFAAQQKNAKEAQAYMHAVAPEDTGKTEANSIAVAYKRGSDGTIGFAMRTSRANANPALADKTERIRAILFANNTDFFYGVWRLNKKRWRGRMRRAMTKSARELAARI